MNKKATREQKNFLKSAFEEYLYFLDKGQGITTDKSADIIHQGNLFVNFAPYKLASLIIEEHKKSGGIYLSKDIEHPIGDEENNPPGVKNIFKTFDNCEETPNTAHAGAVIHAYISFANSVYPLYEFDKYKEDINSFIENGNGEPFCIDFDEEVFIKALEFVVSKELDYTETENPASSVFENSIISQIQPATSILPKINYILNDKINKLLPVLTVDGKPQELTISKARAKKEVFPTISLMYEGDAITYSKNINAYDRAIHNAIISLWEAGNRFFTSEMAYRAMNGDQDTTWIGESALAKIEEAISKLSSIKINIKYKEVAEMYHLKTPLRDLDKWEIEGQLLEVRKITRKVNGYNKTGYMFISDHKPLLYDYNQITKQIVSIEPLLLDTRSTLNTTAEVTVIREYLLRRIEEMKSSNNPLSNKIRFSSIIELLGLENATKQKKAKIREHAEKLLGHYKKIKYIKDYSIYMQGRTIEGVEIKTHSTPKK